MKNSILTSLIVAALVAAGCGSSHPGGGYSYVDDIYYNPRTDQAAGASRFDEPAVLDRETQKTSDREMAQMKRDLAPQTPNQNADFNAIQERYANILANDSISEVDTLVYANDETGYWVDGFDGSDMDRDYAERIVRFHGPLAGVPYWSPLYSEIVYGSNWNWNVYVDGSYAWAFPSWSNPWYYNYYTSPRWSLSFGFGWPYYRNWGYWGGYSAWYSPWYDPWYGYGYPYYGYSGGYYGHQHHYPIGGGGGGRTYTNEVPRRGNATNHSYTPSTTRDSYTRPGITGTTTRRVDEQGNTVISNGQQTYTRPARDSYQQSGGTVKSAGTPSSTEPRSNDRAVRRSYTPTYSQPQSTSRPSYNRTEAPARSSAPTRSSGSGNVTTPSRSSSPGVRYQSSGSTTPPASSGSSGSRTYTRPSRSESSSSPSYSAPSRSSGSYGGGGSSSGGGSMNSGSSSGGGSSNPRSSRR